MIACHVHVDQLASFMGDVTRKAGIPMATSALARSTKERATINVTTEANRLAIE